ncbi:MAG: DNA polymerase III subunit beta [Bacillota bacterium]
MKFVCEKDQLLKAIQTVQRAVAAKTTISTLNCIYIEAKEDHLIFRGTDSEIMIQYIIPLKVEREGKALLPARYLADLVKKLPNIEIVVEQKEKEHIYIFYYGNSKTQLIGMNPEEYPELPSLEKEDSIIIPSYFLENMVRQVSSAAALDTLRPVFSGILIEIKAQGDLNLVATDTHRLAYSSHKITDNGDGFSDISLILPSRSLIEITRLIDEENKLISITSGFNQVLFELGNITIITRVIEGKFPNYEQVIPKNYTTRIKANTKLLREAVDRATLLAQEQGKYFANVLKLSSQGNVLVLEGRSQEIGLAYEEIPVYLEGEQIEVNFNGRYLLDALKIIEEEEVYFDLTGNLSPGVFRPADGKKYLYLILPVRSNY